MRVVLVLHRRRNVNDDQFVKGSNNTLASVSLPAVFLVCVTQHADAEFTPPAGSSHRAGGAVLTECCCIR